MEKIKKQNNWNLSEKIRPISKWDVGGYLDEDVKEAVRLLKKHFKNHIVVISKKEFLDKIDEIFGEKLI